MENNKKSGKTALFVLPVCYKSTAKNRSLKKLA